ncbi:MAG: hypothetical protein ACHQC8_00620 [Solirubrobacterales bacterium]
MSTESIASSSLSVGGTESCASCGAALADDQRYCLECGERRAPMSSVLLGGPTPGGNAQPAPVGPLSSGSPPAGHTAPAASGATRGNTVTVIAGVGVLLLAMGVGVLIGRSGSPRQSAAPAQVISVGSPSGASTSTNTSAATAFSDDWPAGTSGYTVQLQTLPQSATLLSAVEAAKAAASVKGAKGVGALRSEDFSSLTAGSYVIYSGVYHKKAEAQKALGGLKKSFPGASVISVSNGGSHSSSEAAGGSGAGSSLSHPAPPSVVQSLSKKKGKSYEEESKNLPNVISTG